MDKKQIELVSLNREMPMKCIFCSEKYFHRAPQIMIVNITPVRIRISPHPNHSSSIRSHFVHIFHCQPYNVCHVHLGLDFEG